MAAAASGLVVMGMLAVASPAHAAQAPVGLGTTDTYSVLGGQSVTNTGATTLNGDLGVSPGTAISGFPPGLVGGTTHNNDAAAGTAQSDLTTAYNDAAGRAMTMNVGSTLGGRTLTSGVYTASSSAGLTGTLTLDAQGDPTAVFIFQVGSALTTASSSRVSMINGAQACNVFWQIGSSATLGTGSTFIGTIMALTSITVTTGTTVEGRALARNGSVTLDTDVFTAPRCNLTPPSSGTTSSGGGGTGTTSGSGGTGGTGGTGGNAGATGQGGTGTGTGTGTGSGSLADTGTVRVLPLLGIAALLIGVGVALPVMGRGRRRPRRQH